MIVAALELENYKQYSGTHRIEFPDQGIVAVTGPNGAGKTTLFEAIEWCLYCPRTIPQNSVPPHDGVGRTLVRVTLEDPREGKRYCVQRELRSAGTQAEIYLEDNPGQPLVQGTREVTRYVGRHLIGLPHAAFVSTFFTKQKELQFFGDRSATERRTEVGRLLGLEAVREAQREIGEGRTASRTTADSLREEYDRRLGDRDLAAEEAEAGRAMADAEGREADAEREAGRASEDADAARGELDRLRDLQAQDTALSQELMELAGKAATASARHEAATEELKRLSRRAVEREPLVALAGTVDQLAEELERFEQKRERAHQLEALQETLHAENDRIAGIAGRLEQIVADHQAAAIGLDGWIWRNEYGCDVATAAFRLHAIAAGLNPGESRQHVERLQTAHHADQALDEIQEQLLKYQRLRKRLSCQRDELLAAGEPGEAVLAAAKRVRDAREEERVLLVAIAAARVERQEDERVAASLRQHAEEPVCPTCARPLGAKEAKRLVELLEAKMQRLANEEHDLDNRARAAARRIVDREQEEAVARERQEQLRALDQRLSDGQTMIDEATARRDRAAEAMRAALTVIGVDQSPTVEEIERARLEAERVQQIAELAGLLERLGSDARTARHAQEKAEAGIRDLGTVQYDAEAHRAAADRLLMARRASAQVEQIDVELASRAAYERQCLKEDEALAAFRESSDAIAVRRDALAFNADILREAVAAEQNARAAANTARDVHAAMRQAVRDARAALERVAAEHNHLRELIESADAKSREADELTRMYDEFGDFDRYVARHIGPLLAETTERMLSQVTNGKYDHVQFDENYGIEVFDGDEAFPLSGFSGGERDVVALCARLALSEVVGSAALRPPRFLVLDEVFGSLDTERRAQLLETLGVLAESGHFRQMFIISHVDDVQLSPVMHEAWTVEDRDGVSRVVRPEIASCSAI
jgi:exonuclease SbcC